MAQMKEQNKTPEKELNEMEITNLSDTEFKTMIIRMLRKLSENFKSRTKDIEIIKKNQSEMKNTITETKNTLQGNNRLDKAENQISDLEDKEAENTQSECHEE